MPYSFPNNTFSATHFIDSLMKEMGMGALPRERQKPLREALMRQIGQIVLQTAALYLEPNVIDMISAEYVGEEVDPLYFIHELLAYSPQAQGQIVKALDEFYDRTLKTYGILTRPTK